MFYPVTLSYSYPSNNPLIVMASTVMDISHQADHILAS